MSEVAVSQVYMAHERQKGQFASRKREATGGLSVVEARHAPRSASTPRHLLQNEGK